MPGLDPSIHPFRKKKFGEEDGLHRNLGLPEVRTSKYASQQARLAVSSPAMTAERYSQTTMKLASLAIAFAAFSICARAPAEESFPKERIAAGAEIYAVNCSPCHGARMGDPGAAFNLRKF